MDYVYGPCPFYLIEICAMLKLSKLTDYATILLIYLDQHKNVVSSSMLASETNIPEPTVAKILKMLTKASLTRSTRGARSGYSLIHTLQEITLAQVINSIEGPIRLVNCSEDGCRIIATHCCLEGKWNLINEQIKAIFETVTVADLKKQNNKAVSCEN